MLEKRRRRQELIKEKEGVEREEKRKVRTIKAGEKNIKKKEMRDKK